MLPAQIEAVSFSGLPLDAAVKTPVDLPFNQRQTQAIATKVPPDAPYTQLYWLAQPPKGTLYTTWTQKMVGLPEAPAGLVGAFRRRHRCERRSNCSGPWSVPLCRSDTRRVDAPAGDRAPSRIGLRSALLPFSRYRRARRVSGSARQRSHHGQRARWKFRRDGRSRLRSTPSS